MSGSGIGNGVGMGCQNPLGHSGCPHSHSPLSCPPLLLLFPLSLWDFPADPGTPAQTGADYPNFPGNRPRSPLAAPGAAGWETPNLFLLGSSRSGNDFSRIFGKWENAGSAKPSGIWGGMGTIPDPDILGIPEV